MRCNCAYLKEIHSGFFQVEIIHNEAGESSVSFPHRMSCMQKLFPIKLAYLIFITEDSYKNKKF